MFNSFECFMYDLFLVCVISLNFQARFDIDFSTFKSKKKKKKKEKLI
jgi:hypothetical protein